VTRHRLTGAVLASLLSVHAGVAQAAPFPHAAAVAGRWSLLIALVTLVAGLPLMLYMLGVIFYAVGRLGSAVQKTSGKKLTAVPYVGVIRDAVVGADGRVSTSKTVAVVWTYAVASGLLSIVIAKWMGHGHAYGEQVKHGLQGGYAVLIGGPIGAAILAKGIVSNQVSNGASKPTAPSADMSQLVTGDSGQTDLGDLQYVLFNTVALIFFFGELLASPQNGLPTIPDVLLSLTSVSAVGYVAKKALVSTALGITKVDPSSTEAGSNVTLYVAGLVDDQGTVAAPGAVTVLVGAAAAIVSSTALTGEGPAVDVTLPTQLQPGSYDMKLTYNSQAATKSHGLTITT